MPLRTVHIIQDMERGLLFRARFWGKKPHRKAYLITTEKKIKENKTEVFYLYRSKSAPMDFIFAFPSQLKIHFFLSVFIFQASVSKCNSLNYFLAGMEKRFPHLIKSAVVFSVL